VVKKGFEAGEEVTSTTCTLVLLIEAPKALTWSVRLEAQLDGLTEELEFCIESSVEVVNFGTTEHEPLTESGPWPARVAKSCGWMSE
jgi:hypothetical protein